MARVSAGEDHEERRAQDREIYDQTSLPSLGAPSLSDEEKVRNREYEERMQYWDAFASSSASASASVKLEAPKKKKKKRSAGFVRWLIGRKRRKAVERLRKKWTPETPLLSIREKSRRIDPKTGKRVKKSPRTHPTG